MVLAAEFMILIVQIRSRPGYRGLGDPPAILRGFCHSHLGYGGLVGPEVLEVQVIRNTKPNLTVLFLLLTF